MSDMLDREENQDAQVQPSAPGAPGTEVDGAKRPQPEATAVKFPKLEPDDLPKEEPQGIQDIPLEDDGSLPELEDDMPEEKGKLYNFVARMDDKQFRRAQIIFGVVLGILGAIALMVPLPGDDGSGMWNFVIALVIVLWIPRLAERKLEQRLPLTQRWMLIVFVIGFCVSIGVNAAQGFFNAKQAAASPSPSIAPGATPAASVTPAPSATPAP